MFIRLVVFDLAGTTVRDSDTVHFFFQEALRQEGVLISRDEANAVMGIAKPVAIRQLLEAKLADRGRITDAWIGRIHRHFVEGITGFYRSDPSVAEKEGVSETFRALKAVSVRVAVNTGFDRAITDVILDRMGWLRAGLLDASVTSDEVPRGRPYPDMIFRAMELTGTGSAAEVAKVGDTSSDLLEGQAAGCGMVVGVTSGAFTEAELRPWPHTHLVTGVAQLIPILTRGAGTPG
jgi:phosphonatase-like hydrolase